jgi:Bacterial regulatory proteins, luxR family
MTASLFTPDPSDPRRRSESRPRGGSAGRLAVARSVRCVVLLLPLGPAALSLTEQNTEAIYATFAAGHRSHDQFLAQLEVAQAGDDLLPLRVFRAFDVLFDSRHTFTVRDAACAERYGARDSRSSADRPTRAIRSCTLQGWSSLLVGQRLVGELICSFSGRRLWPRTTSLPSRRRWQTSRSPWCTDRRARSLCVESIHSRRASFGLPLASQGRTNRDIAQALFVTARTVEGHRTSIFRKLELDSCNELRASAGKVAINPSCATDPTVWQED